MYLIPVFGLNNLMIMQVMMMQVMIMQVIMLVVFVTAEV